MNRKLVLMLAVAATLATTFVGIDAFAQGAAPSPTDPGPKSLSETLSLLTGVLGTYLAVLAGTSGLTLALLEAFKKLFSVRGRFHRTAVVRWLSQDDASIPEPLKGVMQGPLAFASLLVTVGGSEPYRVREDRKAGATTGQDIADPYSPADAYAEFFHLTTGQRLVSPPKPRSDWTQWRGLDRAVFELEIERLMSQIQDAADAVLNTPNEYKNLYLFLTRGCDPKDVAAWRSYMQDQSGAGATAATKADSDRYGRIRLLMRRQLDAFQGVTSNRWDDMNQLWAVLVGAVILFLAQLVMFGHGVDKAPLMPLDDVVKGWNNAKVQVLVGFLFNAALGGALSPIAKDLVSALSSIKFTK